MAGKDGMTKEEIKEKLNKFETHNEDIKYLQSLKPRIGITKPSTQKAFYDVLADKLISKARNEDHKAWNFDAGVNKLRFWREAMEYYIKSGNKNALIDLGYIFKSYLHPDLAVTAFEKAGLDVKEIEKNVGSPKDLNLDAKRYSTEAERSSGYSPFLKAANRLELLEKEQKDNPSLEERTHLLAIVGGSFLASLLFFSANGITGNVISNSAVRPGNVIGLGLFILGLIAALFYFKEK